MMTCWRVPTLRLSRRCRNRLLVRHEAMPALLLHLGRDGCREIVGDARRDRLVAEAADAIELRLVEPVEQQLEILVGLAGKADDEGRADGEIGTDLAPALDALQRLLLRRRPLHALEHVGAGVLERDVEIGQHLALGHQRDDLVHMRIGIDVMQPHPGAELAERARQIEEAGRAPRGPSSRSPRI